MILCITTVYFTWPLYYFGIFCLLQAWITATIHSDAIDANNANDPTSVGAGTSGLGQAQITPGQARPGRGRHDLLLGRHTLQDAAYSVRAQLALGTYAMLGTGASCSALGRYAMLGTGASCLRLVLLAGGWAAYPGVPPRQ